MLLAARYLHRAALAVLCIAFSTAQSSDREQCEEDFRPRIGRDGKDVRWVPTNEQFAVRMLQAAKTSEHDYVIDLGSGDGTIPIAAAREFGAKALGIEYDPQMVELAQCYVRAERLTNNVEIRQGDIFATDFSEATVLTLYLLTKLNLRLRPTILELEAGTRVVSNRFKLGEWRPDETIQGDAPDSRAYLWIVPARVAGTWRFREQGGTESFRIQLKQRFQQVEGVLLNGMRRTPLRQPTLRGANLDFIVVGHGKQRLSIKGEILGERIEATAVRDGMSIRYVGERE